MSTFVRVPACALGVLLFGFPFTGKAQLQLPVVEQPVVDTTSADSAWQALASSIAAKPRAERTSLQPSVRLYSEIAEQAKRFQTAFPADARTHAARRIEIEAQLRGAAAGGEVSPDLDRRVQEYVADPSLLAKDRFDISFLAKDARFRISRPPDRESALRGRAKIARELIREFPDQSGGYGYLLAIAKALETSQAKIVVQEILQSSAPAVIKVGAQRLLDRIELEGKPFDIGSLGIDRSIVHGRVALVYSWSVQEFHLLDQISRLAAVPGVVFIGVNVDSDREAAAHMVRSKNIPGQQIYDGGGVDGVIASQLHLSMISSIVLIDRNGIVVDVNAHELTAEELRQLAEMKGGKS